MSSHTVEEAQIETDAQEICRLWAENLPVGSMNNAREKLARGYRENPAGGGAIFALKDRATGSMAGIIGVHARTLFMGVQRFEACNLADYAVDRAHRTLGPALALMRMSLVAARERFRFVYALPNRSSLALCRRAGMTELGAMVRYAKVVSSSHQLAQHLPRPIALILAPIVDATLRLADVYRSARMGQRLRFEPGRLDSPELQRIWDRRPGSFLLSDRSPPKQIWRHETAFPQWQVSIARDGAGHEQAYVVWRIRAGLAIVGDFLAIDPTHATAPLLLGFARHARRNGAHGVVVSFFGSVVVTKGIRRAGFFALADSAEPVFALNAPPEAGAGTHGWYFTAFDNDAD